MKEDDGISGIFDDEREAAMKLIGVKVDRLKISTGCS